MYFLLVGRYVICRFIHDRDIGNIKDETIGEALKKGEDKLLWQYNKDDMNVCKNCEYHYGCHTCLALPIDSSEICNYNPEKGQWTNPDSSS